MISKLKYLSIIILLNIVLACNVLGNRQVKKNSDIEKFDLAEFESKSIGIPSTRSLRMIKNDTIIEMSETGDVFIKDTYQLNSPFINSKSFYKDNLSLKADWNRFYLVPYGILKKYDKQGILIEEKDLDAVEKRTFSIYQLIKKMNEDFNIDLTNTKRIGISTTYHAIYGYCYMINVFDYKAPGLHRQMMIDAKIGKTHLDEIISFIK